jgi:hypothetical protein
MLAGLSMYLEDEVIAKRRFFNYFRRGTGLMNLKPSILIVVALVLGLSLITGNAPVYAQAQMTRFEVNQVLGAQKDNKQRYVAGKNTVIRVFLSNPVMVDETKTYVNVWRDGQPVFGLSPKKVPQPVTVVDFLCDSMQVCGYWAAGAYTFQVVLNNGASDLQGPYQFVAGTPIRMLAVPVKANYGGTIRTLPDDKWKNMGQYTEAVYPLAEGNLKWVNYPRDLDASAAYLNLAGCSGCRYLSNMLHNLIPASCKTNPQAVGCYDFVVGFIKEKIPVGGDDFLAGFTFFDTPVFVVVAGDEDAPATIAHELAHKYGIGDTYDHQEGSSIRCTVNPAPDGFKGRNMDDGLKPFNGCTAGRPQSNLTGMDGSRLNGAQVPEAAHPYEVSGRGALPEMADFMSASGGWQRQLWITQDNYDWLYRRLVNREGDTFKVLRLPMDAVPHRFLSFSGSLSTADEVEIAPWESYTDTAELSDTNGPLVLRALNVAGDVVASTAFTVTFSMVSPPIALDRATFSGVIRFPADTVKFQIVKDEAVLAEVPVSTNVPNVANVSPLTVTTLDGPYRITWEGSDPDGAGLTYTVAYNPDVTDPGSPWFILVDDLAALFWDEDFGVLPGGAHAKIRVTVSDGVLTASAESAEFTVHLKAPLVFIDELPWGASYPPGSDILLMAEAYDFQDEWLADNRLEWSSNLSGILGYGSELIVSGLVRGTHRITLTATNSAGLTADDTVTVVVELPGISSGGGGGSNCFIATAAFGSYLHPSVEILRVFRDTFLITGSLGRSFVAWYYRMSPPIADVIRTSPTLKAGVRILLLPAVGFGYLSVTLGFIPALLILFLSAAILCAGMGQLYLMVRRSLD